MTADGYDILTSIQGHILHSGRRIELNSWELAHLEPGPGLDRSGTHLWSDSFNCSYCFCHSNSAAATTRTSLANVLQTHVPLPSSRPASASIQQASSSIRDENGKSAHQRRVSGKSLSYLRWRMFWRFYGLRGLWCCTANVCRAGARPPWFIQVSVHYGQIASGDKMWVDLHSFLREREVDEMKCSNLKSVDDSEQWR